MGGVLQYCFWLRAGERDGCGRNIVEREGEWYMVGTLWMGRGKVGGLGGRWPKEKGG